MKRLDRVSRNCLHGQPAPDDLQRLWSAHKTRAWRAFVHFALVDTLAGEFFAAYREADGVPPETAAAYQRMFGHVAFVGKREDGELVGYWLGPEGRAAADSPIVELDTEGQFRLLGRNLAEYLLACVVSDDDFARLRRILSDLGLSVAARTQSELIEQFDALKREFGNPNRVSWRYQKGLDAPPPSAVPFGSYEFPAAAAALREVGVDGVTAGATKAQIVERLGPPAEVGGGRNVTGLGYVGPWIRYRRPDCLLHIEFKKRSGVKRVVLMEPDWEPGMG